MFIPFWKQTILTLIWENRAEKTYPGFTPRAAGVCPPAKNCVSLAVPFSCRVGKAQLQRWYAFCGKETKGMISHISWASTAAPLHNSSYVNFTSQFLHSGMKHHNLRNFQKRGYRIHKSPACFTGWVGIATQAARRAASEKRMRCLILCWIISSIPHGFLFTPLSHLSFYPPWCLNNRNQCGPRSTTEIKVSMY